MLTARFLWLKFLFGKNALENRYLGSEIFNVLCFW